jgi:hypothetical protein
MKFLEVWEAAKQRLVTADLREATDERDSYALMSRDTPLTDGLRTRQVCVQASFG